MTSTVVEITNLRLDEVAFVSGGSTAAPGASSVQWGTSYAVWGGWADSDRYKMAKQQAAFQAYKAANPDSYDPRADFFNL